MVSNLLYIDDVLVDLSPDTVIALTFQLADIGDISLRLANFSNVFKLPKTPTNTKVCGFIDNIKSQSTFPYVEHKARLIQNGTPTIKNGVAVIKNTTDSFNIVVYSGIYSFFNSIVDKDITELDYTEFEDATGNWSRDLADAYRMNTDGVILPVMQYGFNLRNVAGVIFACDTLAQASPPCFYYHTVISKIFSSVGFTKVGNIFAEDRLLKLVMPAGSEDNLGLYTDKFYSDRSFNASGITNQVMVNPNPAVKVQFPKTVYNGAKQYWNGLDTYDANNDATFFVDFTVVINVVVAGGTVDIGIYKNGAVSVFATAHVDNVGTGTYTLLLPYDIDGSFSTDDIDVRVLTNTGVPTATCGIRIIKGDCRQTDENNVSSRYYNEALPRISQKEFIKDFMLRFALLAKQEDTTVTFKSLQDIITDRKGAVDWTAKRDTSVVDAISNNLDNYGQVNNFLYDVVDDFYTNEFTGVGKFVIANTNLKSKVDFKSIFASTSTQYFHGFNTAYVGIHDATTTDESVFTIDPGNRLLYVRDKLADEPSVRFNPGSTRADFKVAYFEDARYNSLSWQEFIDAYYKRFVEVVQKYKAVDRYYRLTEVDIAKLDLFTLVFDNGDYFLINKVSNFVVGKTTKVQLIRV